MPLRIVTGANGASGINGVSSTPGTNETPGSGTNGAAARAVAVREPNVGNVTLVGDGTDPYGAVYALQALAGSGGRGGDGGTGSVAPAGSGGSGGAGGNATGQASNLSTVLVSKPDSPGYSAASVSVLATGGAGGGGGGSGNGYIGAPGGVGGNGANGGNASVTASNITLISNGAGLAETILVSAAATGGSGGYGGAAVGPQPGDGNGGNGGTAAANISGVSHITAPDHYLFNFRLDATAVGGRGGYSFGSTPTSAVAGYGDGTPGTGGNATASIKGNTITGGQQADFVTLSAQALGGAGADRSSDVGIPFHAADGLSRAVISGNVIDLGGGNDILTIRSNVTTASITGNTFAGGDGYDVLQLSVGDLSTGVRTAGLNFNLSQNTISGFELVSGTPYADRITGDAGDNTIQGGAGNDVLSGGLGNDTLWGGPGADTLTGGGGADTFVFERYNETTFDTIRDFVHGVDHIALTSSFEVLGLLSRGALPTSAFVSGLAATTADQHIIYDRQSGALYYDDDGSGVHAQVQIALLAGRPALTASDFALI